MIKAVALLAVSLCVASALSVDNGTHSFPCNPLLLLSLAIALTRLHALAAGVGCE
jgi:hypothetical protein